MFGMEKKKEANPFVFDLEKELKNEAQRHSLAERLEIRISKLKEILRSGSRKDDFDKLSILLNGYHALALVLGRAAHEPKKKKSI